MDDLVALRRLVDLYGVCVDRGEYTGAAELFLPDGSLSTTVPTRAAGTAEIAQVFASSLGWFAERYGLNAEHLTTQHFVGNHICEVNDAAATGETYCLARICSPDAPAPSGVLNVLRYEDIYAKTDSGWRFRSRNIVRLWSETLQIAVPLLPNP